MMVRARQVVSELASRFWSDLKASTDASLLGVMRFLGLLYGPIDTHQPIDRAFRGALNNRLPRHVTWRHAFGGIAYLLLILLVVTGVLLSFYYRPSAEEAYQSIQHIVSGVRLGWLMRDMHVWGANLLVLAVLAHMARVFFDAAYKPPRETNWLAGVLLLFVVFAFGATGYLLPWDQWAYWMVSEGLEILSHVPIIGGTTVQVLRGDPVVSGATLSRFFAVHVILLPWITMALLMLHFAMVRKHGIAPPEGLAPGGPPGDRFYPNQLLRSLAVALIVVAVTITGAVLYPRPVADVANPAHPPGTLISSWVVADVSRGLTYYLGAWGLSLFILLGIAMALVPLFDRHAERGLRRRPVVATLGMVFFLGFAVAWVAGRRLRVMPPQVETGQPSAIAPTLSGSETAPVSPDSGVDTAAVRDSTAGRSTP
jgi:quinol-cytochrome oxidoreductase complex cytochrome b subunit